MTRRALLGAAALGVLTACTTKDTRSVVPRQVPVDGQFPAADDRSAGPHSVLMIGDSITLGSKNDLTALFTYLGFTSITIDGAQGRRIQVGNGKSSTVPLNGIDTAKKLIAAKTPDELWVIALGTNDIGQMATEQEYRDLIDEMVAVVPRDRPLIWVNCYRKEFIQANRQFNDLLLEMVDTRGNAAVADWIGTAEPRAKELLRTDGLHPNDNGQIAFAQVVGAAARYVT